MSDPTTGTTGTVLLVDDSTPNLAGILRMLDLVQRDTFDMLGLPERVRLLDQMPVPTAVEIAMKHNTALPTLFGMQVRLSNLLDDMPVRFHRKKKWMSDAYHRRIQKKWNKRFGVGPVAVMMNANRLTAPSGDHCDE